MNFYRYPGEWKFPGGVVESEDRTFRETALRELQEEFIGINISTEEDAKLYLFNKKTTLPVQRKQYLMHNYVAFAEENLWITDDIEVNINGNLRRRVENFNKIIADGSFWDMNVKEKYLFSPEIMEVRWIGLDDAIQIMSSSMNNPVTYVNSWQQTEFERYGVAVRDPMYQSMITLQDIQRFTTIDEIRKNEVEVLAAGEVPS